MSKPRTAIIQCADTGPLESLVVMLRAVGYSCYVTSKVLNRELRSIGCDTVIDNEDLVRGMGYDVPFEIPQAGIADMSRRDIFFIDLKAHRNGPKIWSRWPHLEGRILWYRINGGKPEHVVNERGDHGDEINPCCPVITPNQWYKVSGEREYVGQDELGHQNINWPTEWRKGIREGKFYTFWPPFYRWSDYLDKYPRPDLTVQYDNPVCLIHNLEGWGYRDLIYEFQELGVKMYGRGSPNGLIEHSRIPKMLSTALCMVHLKSSDAPGYALYEACAAGCPIVLTRRLVWRNRMQELFDTDTCLMFDRETHDPLTEWDVRDCVGDVYRHLKDLQDPVRNAAYGLMARGRLQHLMWNEKRDRQSLDDFLTRNFK